jgi:hypothetical protein
MFQNSSTKPDKVNSLLGVRPVLLTFFCDAPAHGAGHARHLPVKSAGLTPINTLLLAGKFNKDVLGCFYLKNNQKYH